MKRSLRIRRKDITGSCAFPDCAGSKTRPFATPFGARHGHPGYGSVSLPSVREGDIIDHRERKLFKPTNINRRQCMTWVGAGVVWSLSGGVPRTLGLLGSTEAAATPQSGLLFVQISDSHIGFHLPPNPDPVATLMEAIDKIKAMLGQPAFLVHTERDRPCCYRRRPHRARQGCRTLACLLS